MGSDEVPDPAARVLFLLVVGLATTTTTGHAAQPSAPASGVQAFVRVDQVGYGPDEAKVASLLATHPWPGAAFTVEDERGRSVLEGTTGASRGRWNKTFGAVQPLDLSALSDPGRYRITVAMEPPTSSPWFVIGQAPEIRDPLVADAVSFFAAQHDGPDVIPGPLHRLPSHLNDRSASLYAWPTYENEDSDVIVGDLQPLDETTDLAGGWFDAGDFIKFAHTTAYADALLWATLLELGAAAPSNLEQEARFGLDWLTKAWHPSTGVLDLQVGIGSGNQEGTFWGDHDLWRLPEEDDQYPGAEARYVRDRPAFRANEPGTPLPPNLAGRVAAAFALAARFDASAHPDRAREELEVAAAIFEAAKVEAVADTDVVTALPHAFYPESSWRDDLELGAAEVTLAAQALSDARAPDWLEASAHWAREYLDREAGNDSFNLYLAASNGSQAQ